MTGRPCSYKTDIRDVKIVHVSCRAKCPLHLLARGEKLLFRANYEAIKKLGLVLVFLFYLFKQWTANEDSKFNRSI